MNRKVDFGVRSLTFQADVVLNTRVSRYNGNIRFQIGCHINGCLKYQEQPPKLNCPIRNSIFCTAVNGKHKYWVGIPIVCKISFGEYENSCHLKWIFYVTLPWIAYEGTYWQRHLVRIAWIRYYLMTHILLAHSSSLMTPNLRQDTLLIYFVFMLIFRI